MATTTRRIGPADDPLDKLPNQPPEGGDGNLRLFAQPFSELRLIGELFHSSQLAHQRLVIQPLGVS